MSANCYSQTEIEQFTSDAERDGFCILRDHFPIEKLRDWQAHFAPLLTAHIEREGAVNNRGSARHYVTLPFDAPFADEAVFADADILAIVENLVGADFVMCQLATDTPLLGSDYQEIHRDAPPLFPDWTTTETPMFQLAVNFPLVDVTPENGPFEVARGTHNIHKEAGLKMLAAGEAKLEAVCLKLGDVMIRDVRGLHRGTPNRTDEPRPMCVIGYSRKWLLRPEVSINIPRRVWENLSAPSQQMLRFNQIVESIETAKTDAEVYQSFAF